MHQHEVIFIIVKLFIRIENTYGQVKISVGVIRLFVITCTNLDVCT